MYIFNLFFILFYHFSSFKRVNIICSNHIYRYECISHSHSELFKRIADPSVTQGSGMPTLHVLYIIYSQPSVPAVPPYLQCCSTHSTNQRLCSTSSTYYWKKPIYKYTHTVQPCIVQGSTVTQYVYLNIWIWTYSFKNCINYLSCFTDYSFWY